MSILFLSRLIPESIKEITYKANKKGMPEAAIALSQKYRIPYVVAIRNTDLNDFFKKMIHLRSHGVKILMNASAVFFLSPVYREKVIEKYVPEEYRKEIREKSYIIPNGIDDFWHQNLFERDALTTQSRIQELKKIKCIYVGGIDKNKNLKLTLKALVELEKDGWECTLTSVGKVVDKTVYDQLVKYKQFKYVGPKKKEELIAYYREADIFVMPSYTETFGLVYAEALSQGLPVIYTRGQGFDGQFSEGEVGLGTDSNSFEELKKDIISIVENYASVSVASRKGSRKYNWEDIVNNYSDIYETIVVK